MPHLKKPQNYFVFIDFLELFYPQRTIRNALSSSSPHGDDDGMRHFRMRHPEIFFTRIDASRNRLAAIRFAVRAYPSFYIVYNKQVYLYTEQHAAENLCLATSNGSVMEKNIIRLRGLLCVYCNTVFFCVRSSPPLVISVDRYRPLGGSIDH